MVMIYKLYTTFTAVQTVCRTFIPTWNYYSSPLGVINTTLFETSATKAWVWLRYNCRYQCAECEWMILNCTISVVNQNTRQHSLMSHPNEWICSWVGWNDDKCVRCQGHQTYLFTIDENTMMEYFSTFLDIIQIPPNFQIHILRQHVPHQLTGSTLGTRLDTLAASPQPSNAHVFWHWHHIQCVWARSPHRPLQCKSTVCAYTFST